MDGELDQACYERNVNDLPDEVLEYILSLLPPYRDLEQCMLVCKRWKKNVSNVIHHTKHKMMRSLANFDIKWENVTPPEKFQSITKRYSHSACFHENYMYVFGGCTCTSTTFNDLWKLDLSTRKWFRLLTMGSYPSPKACATLTRYDGSLLLFGGWTHPSPYPLHQAWRTFNELHVYDIATNRWEPVTTPTNSPPPMAGHSVSVHKDVMVVFGGLHGQNGSSNDIWCFNLSTYTWTKQAVNGIKPQSRYGQSQIALDEGHLLILGGCGGGNMNLNDIWLLSMTDPVWKWREVAIRNPQWAASHLWCHPACRVGNYVVVFSRNPVTLAPMFSYSKWRPNSQLRTQANSIDGDPSLPQAVRRASESVAEPHFVDRDVNVNGRRGSLTIRNTQVDKNRPVIEDKDLELPSSSSIPNNSISSNSPSKSLESPTSSITNLIESNVISVLHSSSEESLSDQENITSKNYRSQGSLLNHSSKQNDNSNSAKSDNIRNISLSGDRTPSNFNKSNSANRRLGFISPPNCNNSMAAFRDNSSVGTNNSRQRERQLEALRRIEDRLRNKNKEKNSNAAPFPAPSGPADLPSPSTKKDVKTSSPSTTVKLLSPKMAMFVLDISSVLSEECYVSWLPVKSVAEDSPDDMILYTLVLGNGELIMFGGIQKDAMSINQQAQSTVNITNIMSNSLHFISPPHNII